MSKQVMVCGVDCTPTNGHCNGYCQPQTATHRVDSPPLATPAMVLATKREKAYRLLREAQKAWYEYYGECEVGPERIRSSDIYAHLMDVR